MWVAALRSGEFKQAQGGLKSSEGYCCLGVLCELHRRETVAGEWSGDASLWLTYGSRPDDPDGNAYGLPKIVQKWAGLETGDPRLGSRDEDDEGGGGLPDTLTASGCNDDVCETFKQIADRIEKRQRRRRLK